MLFCRLCHQRITFDDFYVSEKSGKKIPLDYDTEEPHNCPMWESKDSKYKECNKGCGHEIYFDPDQRTVNGKWIPIARDTDQPHNCPNIDFEDEDEGDGDEEEGGK